MKGHSNLFPLAAAAGLTALSIACASSGGISKPPEPASPAVLSRDDAIDAALQRASGLIGEDEIQETTAFYTTYGGAYEALGFETPLPGSARPSGETPVWVVTFKGMFYEPQGPRPEPTVTPKAREPTCSEVVVLISDGVEPNSPDSWSELTFRPAGSCS
ncbi:MAG TPA: hypothetical protein VJ253_03705 [Dehalococcoidia bacterium]|nr:hypothetical protein [Dehalococcoidia bacterium]